jgi:5'-nucleotidase / UDP-sugar diphosphatase
MRGRMGFGVLCSALALGCSQLPFPRQEPEQVLTLLHTSDIHSRVWPFRSRISAFEADLGLGPAGAVEELGGLARLTTLLESERRRGNTLWLDSGDALEGAEVFHRYGGRVELTLLSSLGLGAMALGNHELSLSGAELGDLLTGAARFPVLAANLRTRVDSPLAGLLRASAVLEVGGLRVGVVGVANHDSPPNLASPDNPWGVEDLTNLAAEVQAAVDQLLPQAALIVVLSHLGLDGDRALVQATTGIDLLLGGHQHILTAEPEWQQDCASTALQDERGCSPRRVPIVHSGAYSKWLSRLELTLAPDPAEPGQLELLQLALTHLPLGSQVAPDASVTAFLEALRPAPEPPLAFLPAPLPRAAALGGDSPLGSLTAGAMLLATEADIALLNSSGLRSDLEAGVLQGSDLELAFPFDEPWRLGWLSARSLRQGLERAAWRSAGRNCVSVLQVAGLRLRLHCGACSARRSDCLEVVRPSAFGDLALLDDQLLLVALPAYLTLAGADFEDAASDTTEISGSVSDALRRYVATLPAAGEADVAACAASLGHFAVSRCVEAFGPVACPLSTEHARSICRELPAVGGGRDDRVEMLP